MRRASSGRSPSQRDVAVPARAASPLLAQRNPQRPNQLPPRASGLDDIVDVSPLRGNEGIGEAFCVFVDELAPPANGGVGASSSTNTPNASPIPSLPRSG